MARIQAAAIPYRRDAHGALEVLLVTSRTRRRWVLPKGKIKRGMLDHKAAAMEAFEEAGVIGSIARIATATYRQPKVSDKGRSFGITIRAFPLRVENELSSWPEQRLRKRAWMNVEEAQIVVADSAIGAVLRNFAGLYDRDDPHLIA